MRLSSIFQMALACLTISLATAQPKVIIQADQPGAVISRHIYGHFSEHLGRCIYDGFYVGEKNSTLPHTAGVRNDIIKALQDLQTPNLRWPGGCFADTYHWKDGIGPKASRPSIVNSWWGGVTEDNSFGTHDFLDMCEKIGAEPYISGNVGSGTVQELADWVQYTNFDGKSPMSDLRQKNGRNKGWSVKYWGIGNEAWGCGGNMTAEYYANEYRRYATFMQASWNGKLFRIASGASSGDYHWTEVLMREVPAHLMEGVALHHYSVIDWNKKSSATAFTESEYFTTMQRAWQMEELVTRHTTIMDKYDPQRRIALVVDEWGGWYDVEPGTNPGFLYQQNTLRDAMIAGVTLNIFNNHAERVRMANLAQTINVLQAVILTEGNKMLLTPTYHVMRMFNVHQDARLLPYSLEGADYLMNNAAVPALHVSASKDSLGVTHVSLVNIDSQKSHDLNVELRGMSIRQVTGEILTSARIQDHNTFQQPETVKPKKFEQIAVHGQIATVRIPSASIIVLTVK